MNEMSESDRQKHQKIFQSDDSHLKGKVYRLYLGFQIFVFVVFCIALFIIMKMACQNDLRRRVPARNAVPVETEKEE